MVKTRMGKSLPAIMGFVAVGTAFAVMLASWGPQPAQLSAGIVVEEEEPAVEPPDPPPGPLSSIAVPMPPNANRFLKNKQMAIVLGKALFWDMQAGSDCKQACASCHFHAGVDNRTRNSLGLPPNAADVGITLRGANLDIESDDFPFHKLADPFDRDSEVLFDTGEVFGSQGVIFKKFKRVIPMVCMDHGRTLTDLVFNVSGINVRRVEPRNTPTMINAVFNDRNFWDGRANRFFNGVNPFGDQDNKSKVWVNRNGQLKRKKIRIDNSSLASQAVGPPLSDFEMSWAGRTFPDLARKMLSLVPLARQTVHPNDSVLGPWRNMFGGKGLIIDYPGLIKAAFKDKWWSAPGTVKAGNKYFTHMEANFSLFWGLAIQCYEQTLVSDDSPFDRFAQGRVNALTKKQKKGLDIFLNEGKCIACHKGAEFTGAAMRFVRADPIEFMAMADGIEAFYDNGFYNIGVRPTEEDPGVGGVGPFGPFSLTRRRQEDPNTNIGGQNIDVPPGARTAVDGAFKVSTLRNIELTGPYMHNGGMKSLTEVVEFYVRGTDFDNFPDKDPDVDGIEELVNKPGKVAQLVAFLESLTDDRVRFKRAPFDHPEIRVANGHKAFVNGKALDNVIKIRAVGANGVKKPLKSFEQVLSEGGL